MNRAELEMKKQQLEKDVAKYYNMQMAKKIQLNSAYVRLVINTLDFMIYDKH